MWSIRRCTGSRSCYEQGRTPRRLQIFYQDGSVAVPQNFAASWPSIEQSRTLLDPYVEEFFKLLIKNGSIMSSCTRFIYIDKLLYNCYYNPQK